MVKPILQIENSEDKIRFIAFGDWVVQHSKELKDALLKALAIAKEVHLELNGVTALDVTGIQLVFAWKNDVMKQGAKVMVSMPTDSSLLDLLEKSRITKMF